MVAGGVILRCVVCGADRVQIPCGENNGSGVGFFDSPAVQPLRDRFDMVLDAIESEGEWVTNRVRLGKLILGRLGDIEAGVRQLIRARPLETAIVELPSGRELCVPTVAETLRIKAFLIVRRNQTRDFLDVAALTEMMGTMEAAAVLADIDEYYADQRIDGVPVSSQVARQLADPRPADSSVTQQLSAYRNLDRKWHDWSRVRDRCQKVAIALAGGEDDTPVP